MTPIEYVGLALYRLIFLLGLFNLLSGILGFFAPDLLKAMYRKLFRLDFDARIVPDAEPGPAKHLTRAELAELEAARPAPAPLKVYVAASSRELERVDRALAGLSKIPNVEVTYRWIDDMRKQMAKGLTDADLTREEAMDASKKCFQGVLDADLFWLLYPNEPTRGAWIELGYARGVARTLVVSYEGRTSAGACPLALCDWEDDYHETLGDQRGLEIIGRAGDRGVHREEGMTMTRDELEKEARNVADLVRVEIRHHFQIRRPHYTPPPWENPGGDAWMRWRDRNLEMHGLQGCQERFPTHFPSSLWDPQDPRSRPPSVLDGLVVTPPSEEVLAGLTDGFTKDDR